MSRTVMPENTIGFLLSNVAYKYDVGLFELHVIRTLLDI